MALPNNQLLKYLKFSNQLLLDNMSGPRTKLPVTPMVSVLTEVVTKDLASVHRASSWVLTSRFCLVGLLLCFPAENVGLPTAVLPCSCLAPSHSNDSSPSWCDGCAAARAAPAVALAGSQSRELSLWLQSCLATSALHTLLAEHKAGTVLWVCGLEWLRRPVACSA